MSDGMGLLYWTEPEGSVSCGVVDSRPLTMGTGPICGLPLQGEGVSVVHAVLRATPDGHIARKLTKVGKLTINGEDTEQGPLKHGDRIGLGTETVSYYRADKQNPNRLKMSISRLDTDHQIEVEVDGPLLYIGRDEGDVVISDHTISGTHLEIAYFGGTTVWVCDLESTNGSFVGDEPLYDRREVDIEDLIRVGRVTLQFSEGEAIEEGTHSPQRSIVFPDESDMA